MKTLTKSILIVLCIILLSSAQLFGQKWSEEQLEVWKVIEAEWAAGIEQDTTLYDKFLHEKFLSWNIQPELKV